MLLIDTAQKCIIDDDQFKLSASTRLPYSDWLREIVTLHDILENCRSSGVDPDHVQIDALKTPTDVQPLLSLFGYTLETLTMLLVPMLTTK